MLWCAFVIVTPSTAFELTARELDGRSDRRQAPGAAVDPSRFAGNALKSPPS